MPKRVCQHCGYNFEIPDWMVGKATITMVMSNSNMKVAAHTTTKVHHFFSMTNNLPVRPTFRHRFPDICVITP